MRVLRIPLLALALAGLIAVTGCGSSDSSSSETLSNEAYADQATAVLSSFASSFQSLGSQLSSSKDPQQLSDGLTQAEDQIQGTIDDLKALQPPEAAQQGQDQLVTALEGFSSELTTVNDALGSGDKSQIKAALAGLQTAGLKFQSDLGTAQKSLEDAGITLGPGNSTSGATDSTTG